MSMYAHLVRIAKVEGKLARWSMTGDIEEHEHPHDPGNDTDEDMPAVPADDYDVEEDPDNVVTRGSPMESDEEQDM